MVKWQSSLALNEKAQVRFLVGRFDRLPIWSTCLTSRVSWVRVPPARLIAQRRSSVVEPRNISGHNFVDQLLAISVRLPVGITSSVYRWSRLITGHVLNYPSSNFFIRRSNHGQQVSYLQASRAVCHAQTQSTKPAAARTSLSRSTRWHKSPQRARSVTLTTARPKRSCRKSCR